MKCFFNQVKDPISAVTNVDDYSGSARYQPAKINLKLEPTVFFFTNLSRLLAATTLRNVLGTRNLGDILSERESIAQEMQVRLSSYSFTYYKVEVQHQLDFESDFSTGRNKKSFP